MALYLAEGHVEFTFDLGTGSATIRCVSFFLKTRLSIRPRITISKTQAQRAIEIPAFVIRQSLQPIFFVLFHILIKC